MRVMFEEKLEKNYWMNKKFYEIIYDCIVTGQVSSDRIAKYLKDKGFYKYWKEKNGNVKKEIR